MKVVFPNRFVRYDLIRCIALASFVHTPSGLSTAVWPETDHFETEPDLTAEFLPVAGVGVNVTSKDSEIGVSAQGIT
jgi:hypothetical protein